MSFKSGNHVIVTCDGDAKVLDLHSTTLVCSSSFSWKMLLIVGLLSIFSNFHQASCYQLLMMSSTSPNRQTGQNDHFIRSFQDPCTIAPAFSVDPSISMDFPEDMLAWIDQSLLKRCSTNELEYVIPWTIRPLLEHKGFCNSLYLIERKHNATGMIPYDRHGKENTTATTPSTTTIAILKIYSDLANERRQVSSHKAYTIELDADKHSLDEQLGDIGLGRPILASTPDALLMEYLEGAYCLTEERLIEFFVKTDNKQTKENANVNDRMEDEKVKVNLKNDSQKQEQITMLDDVAHALAQLHSLYWNEHGRLDIRCSKSGIARTSTGSRGSPPPQYDYPHMLWDSLDILLERIDDASVRNLLQEEVYNQRQILEKLHLPIVDFGHGDCKPSNIMMLSSPLFPASTSYQNNNSDNNRSSSSSSSSSNNNNNKSLVRFIDLETCGRHYRAFDLAKLFRAFGTSYALNDNGGYKDVLNYRSFLKAYLEEISRLANNDTCTELSIATESDIDQLLLETQLLLPMTWLEASVFFYASQQPEEWREMAEDRWDQYRLVKACFESTVQRYEDRLKECSGNDDMDRNEEMLYE